VVGATVVDGAVVGGGVVGIVVVTAIGVGIAFDRSSGIVADTWPAGGNVGSDDRGATFTFDVAGPGATTLVLQVVAVAIAEITAAGRSDALSFPAVVVTMRVVVPLGGDKTMTVVAVATMTERANTAPVRGRGLQEALRSDAPGTAALYVLVISSTRVRHEGPRVDASATGL
jgi:hypothetical protein